MAKVYDSWDNTCKSKFGAMKRNEECRFAVRIPKSVYHDLPPIMVIFRTGFKERYIIMNESASNDEYTEYSAFYKPLFVGVHYYYFTLVCGGTRAFIKRKGASEGIIGEGDLFQLTVYDENYKTPDFIKGGVFYQIFPDRFFKSEIEYDDIPEGRVLRDDWGGTPFYKPDEYGHVWNNDYFGGNLQGIIYKLPYLKDLGVTCLYLNPIFEAHENHRYNTADYRKVDPLLGTNADFRRLCSEADKYGISIILDGVFSHTGADSIYFNKFSRYDSVGAYNSAESKYYPWYSFIKYPNEYESWWGIDTLPNVNETNPQFSEYICGEGGVLDYWLYMGAAGFRLDVADELPDEFLDKVHGTLKRNGKEKLLIGEVWEDASNKESYGVKRRYLLGRQLDSVMNYPFRDAILEYAKSSISGSEFFTRIMTILENYPKPSIDTLMNFISTHDVERAITVLGGESCAGKSKDWQSETRLDEYQYDLGRKRLKCAMVLQFFLPGVPCIYYGDEAGAEGYKDPFNRRCFPWGNEDPQLIDFVRQLSKIREFEVFREADFKVIFSDGDLLCFARIEKEKKCAAVIILNRGGNEQSLSADISYFKHYSEYKVLHGRLTGSTLIVPPYDYCAVKIIISADYENI